MSEVIKMPKRFDYSASSEFNTAVSAAIDAAQDDKNIVLDCAQMEYLDSAGIGLMVMAHKRATSRQCRVSVLGAKPTVKEILLLANLQKLIDIQ